MAVIRPEAYLLLSFPSATLTSSANDRTYSGILNLECVTVTLQDVKDFDNDIYLVVRIDEFETALDPSKAISLTTTGDGSRSYTFHESLVPNFDGTHDLILHVPSTVPMQELETFDGILTQYADNFYTGNSQGSCVAPVSQASQGISFDQKDEDLRGHLVLVDEDNGQVIGALDTKLTVHEDPSLQEKGKEHEPVVIEVPEDEDLDNLAAHEVFVRAIPPGEGSWMTKGASLVSQAITAGTALLLTGVTRASDYYVSHSSPVAQSSSQDGTSASSSKPGPSRSSQSLPLALLTSDRTRKSLTQVHAISGQAVKVSQKTIGIVEGLVKHVVGGSTLSNPGQSSSSRPVLPPRKSAVTTSPGYSPAPPPYTPYKSTPSTSMSTPGEKPPLPPRRSRSPAPLAPTAVLIPTAEELPKKLSTRDRLALSADLILSTLDDSTKKIFDVGSDNVAKVTGHKYGPEAGHNTRLLMHTGRNVVLVYIDMRGFGRRALMKKAGKEFVKSRVLSKRTDVGKSA